MKNIIKFQIGDREFVADNHVTNASEYWLNETLFTAYMSVFYNGKRVDKKTELVEFNDNIVKGELFATYRIYVSDTEMPYGITKVGFAPYPEAELATECEVSTPETATVIYGTIYLESIGPVAIYPGENPLVRSLLGMRKLGEISVRAINSSLGNVVALVDHDSYVPIQSTDCVADDCREIEFDAESYSDFMLYVDSLPCARFNAMHVFPFTHNVSVTSDYGFDLPEAISVDDARFAGNPIEYGFFYNISKLYPTGKEGMDKYHGYKLFCDPMHRHVGVKTNSLYRILDVETRSVIKSGSYKGELTLCADGSLVSVDNGEIKFIDKKDTANIMKGSTVVLWREGGYDIFVLVGNVSIDNNMVRDVLYRYRYESSLVMVDGLYLFTPGQKLGIVNNYVVAVYGPSSKYALTATEGVIMQTYQLEQVNDEPIALGIYHGDGYIGSVFRLSKHECDNAFNEFYVKDDVLSFVGTFTTNTLGVKENVEDAILVGDTVILREKGVLNFYKVATDGVYVCANADGTVTCVEHALYQSQLGKIKLKIKSKEDI